MSAAEAHEPIKVAKWNAVKVKIALDDAVRDAFMKRGYVEDFSSTDMKLIATAAAIAIAGYGIYYRYAALCGRNVVLVSRVDRHRKREKDPEPRILFHAMTVFWERTRLANNEHQTNFTIKTQPMANLGG